MEKGHQNSIWIIGLTIFLSFLFSSLSYAKTYKWEDFTEPFKNKFELNEGQNVTIEIHLPEFIIKNYKTVPLYIDYSINHSGSNYPNVRVNKSIWATYYLTNSKFLNIKTKHLQSGLNKFKFCIEGDISERHTSVDTTIREIRFEFIEIESLRVKFSKKNDLKSKPANSDSNKIKEDQQKHYDLQKLKAFNRSLDKSTRKYLQYALKHLGYYHGRVDGLLGRNTRKAIKAYQKNEQKLVTGYLDKESVKKLAKIGRVASKNAKKKAVGKAKINKTPVKVEKKKSAVYHVQTKKDNQLQPKKILTAENLKEKIPKNENRTNIEKESGKQEIKKVEIDKLRNDGLIKTPEELEARYKSLIDTFNQAMNETFYNQLIASIESCNRTRYYVSGAFISHYLYIRFNDLASMAQESSDVQRKTKLAEHFKNTRNQMIRYYNGSAENIQALKAVLGKCDVYYKKTDTRYLLSKKMNFRIIDDAESMLSNHR
jgi:peptidoglycan hydrolase-like protein with peptidoglycan-binding domain